MSGMRVLVTGSTGCIGSHAVRILLDEGAEVFGFNRSAPEGPPADNYRHRTGDLSNPESVSQVVKEVQPNRVLHLGALQTPDCRDYPMLWIGSQFAWNRLFVSGLRRIGKTFGPFCLCQFEP